MQGAGFRVQSLGFNVEGLGFGVKRGPRPSWSNQVTTPRQVGEAHGPRGAYLYIYIYIYIFIYKNMYMHMNICTRVYICI